MKSDEKSGTLENVCSHEIRVTTWSTGSAEMKDHFLARVGFNRMGHRVAPGLYSIGHPGPESPVFVTANYTLSFDALRSSLRGVDCCILMLETEGGLMCGVRRGRGRLAQMSW